MTTNKARIANRSSADKFQLFTDGITNKLVGCYHRPAVSATATTPTAATTTAAAAQPFSSAADVVLIRVYGNKTELLIDRQTETRNIKMLQRHGFAPSLYAVFQNGLAYEFVPGCTLSTESVSSAAVWPLVARHMARMHRLAVRPTDVDSAGEAVPMLGTKMRQFMALVPERFGDAAKETR